MDSRMLLSGHWPLGHWRIWFVVGSSDMGAFTPRRSIGVGRHFFGSSGGVGVVDVVFAVSIVGWLVYFAFFFASMRMGYRCLFDVVALYPGALSD